ncbi:MAG: SPASM domain-containing protein, partial [Candidatus Sumerlaeaceae bacterium]|nr:SPASM domain-containing protein [Candidatus Sumerlaeaceae bacterium]
ELGVELHVPPPYHLELPAPPAATMWDKIGRITRLISIPDRFPQKCSSPWKEPYVHTNGQITPCCSSNQYLGDLKKDSFAAIWNGWRYKLLRLRIHSPIPPPACRKCFVCWGINAGNAGNVMAREGLLVKLWYFFEYRFESLILTLQRRLGKIPSSPAGEPNFYRGRPMTESNKPAST